MKYRLKDRELQRKLDDLSAINRFSYCLQEEAWKKQSFDGFNYIRVDFGQRSMLDDGKTPTHSIYILKADIEEYEEYNPKTWNKYPEVEPPEDVLMRVELNDGGRKCALFHHFSDGDSWCHPDGSCLPKFYSDCVTRFRPWDD